MLYLFLSLLPDTDSLFPSLSILLHHFHFVWVLDLPCHISRCGPFYSLYPLTAATVLFQAVTCHP